MTVAEITYRLKGNKDSIYCRLKALEIKWDMVEREHEFGATYWKLKVG
jgi:hypothetical protein